MTDNQFVSWFFRHFGPHLMICDNSPKITSKAKIFWMKERRTKLDFVQAGKSTQGAFVEI